jgi:hypothetical protein
MNSGNHIFIQERFERMSGPILSSCGTNIQVPASKKRRAGGFIVTPDHVRMKPWIPVEAG